MAKPVLGTESGLRHSQLQAQNSMPVIHVKQDDAVISRRSKMVNTEGEKGRCVS